MSLKTPEIEFILQNKQKMKVSEHRLNLKRKSSGKIIPAATCPHKGKRREQ
jgi:hypothetical protein